jgi:DNA-binding response OmpR family regulator
LIETILIVDDEIEVADTCARVLERAGYNCLVAYDCPAGLVLFDSRHPALVLSDINLPTRVGLEIARYVRHKSPGTPVVLMTTYHSSRIPEYVMLCGAARYLRKPFSNAELTAVIKSCLPPGPDGPKFS